MAYVEVELCLARSRFKFSSDLLGLPLCKGLAGWFGVAVGRRGNGPTFELLSQARWQRPGGRPWL